MQTAAGAPSPGGAVSLRALLLVIGAVQLGWHLVTALLPASGLAGCLPAVGRLASAGLQLAWLSVPGSCGDAAAVDARQVALAALITAAPLLVGHLTASLLAAGGWVGAVRLLAMVVAVLRLVVPRLPGAASLPAAGEPRVTHRRPAVAHVPAVLVAGLSRRGPPAGLPA